MAVYTIERRPDNGNFIVFADDKNIGEFGSQEAATNFVKKAQAAQEPPVAANENTPAPDMMQLLSWACHSLHQIADAMVAQTKILAAVYSDIPQEERSEEVLQAIRHLGE